MDGLSQLNTMLQRIQAPAFRVEKGVITHVNQAASAHLIEVGQAFAPMILSGGPEYEDFSAGELYVTLTLAGISIGAHISSLENGDLVILEQTSESPELQAMALAAKMLRKPLDGILNLASQILPAAVDENPELKSQADQMNRRIYQMMRLINNMSDTAGYAQAQMHRMETVEICSFLKEIMEKAVSMTTENNISIAYEIPNAPIFTLADPEQLERAVYNLLSNAIKSATPGTTVRMKLVRKNTRLYISICNSHRDFGSQSSIFNRYLRNPAQVEDPKNGLGLGMTIVCSTAMVHGGAVLVDKTEDGTRITMTLQIRTKASNQVLSPILRFDYAGEHDHCLVELADVLPAEHYSVDQIK